MVDRQLEGWDLETLDLPADREHREPRLPR
jgi:hypothetical protein